MCLEAEAANNTTATATLDARPRVTVNCGNEWAPPGQRVARDSHDPLYLWLITGRVRRQYRIRSGKTARDSATWGEERQIRAGGVNIPVYDVTDNQAELIRRTLCRVSPTHLRLIPRIICDFVVGPVGTGRVRSGGNSRCGDDIAQANWAMEITYSRLNPPCEILRDGIQAIEDWYADDTYLCGTIYHELGHFIDAHYHFMARLSAGNRETLENWFQTLDYEGQTMGPGERIAEANSALYRGLLTRDVQSRRILDLLRSQPAYSDEETSRVIETLYLDL